MKTIRILRILLSAVMVLSIAGIAMAGHEHENIWERETFTNGFWGLNDKLADEGIEVGFGLTQIYQTNVHGGLSKHRRQGRHTGSYDLEIEFDAEKLFGLEGGTFFMHGEGSWSRSDIDATSIGSAFGVNGDAAGRRALDITELWYEQAMFGDTLRLRLGKMDITGGFECRGCPVSFDGSAYANDETAQFLNNALVNNPTIPFPDFGLGAVLYWNPVEWWYLGAGVIDAQADGRETGFRTTFHDEDFFFYAFETGIAPRLDSTNGSMQGTYRVGMWIDAQDKAKFSNGKNYRDDIGFYLSCDQLVYKENSNPEDTQGFGVFCRFGWADDDLNEIGRFWSIGLQYQGLVNGRDDDVLGLGFAQGVFSDQSGANDGSGYSDDHENVLELYYNTQVTPWLNVSPSLQYVSNPGGDKAVSDAVVFGVRLQMTF